MARTSRREQPALPTPPRPTAAYARLSREKADDGSLQTQVALLHRFIREAPELTLVDTYIDSGVTGTTFDRPEFSRMMEDVYSGRVACIVVKDLSRFGRNLIEAGYYLETIFPKLDVRLIALTDAFDSGRREDRESLAGPIRNLVNDFCARECSRKQIASFELHSRLGDRRRTAAPYGYLLDRAANTLRPDPATGPTVQLIFRWFLLGVGPSEIAHRLNELGVPSPREEKVRQGYAPPGQSQDRLWAHSGVRRILQNRVYLGDWVLGQRRSAQYKNLQPYNAEPEAWFLHTRQHPPLIREEEFAAVQARFEASVHREWARGRRVAPAEANLFRRKVRCLDCGRTMYYFRKSCGGSRNTGAVYKCYAAGRGGDTSTDTAVRRAGKRYLGSRNADGTPRDCGRMVNEDYVKLVTLDALRALTAQFRALRCALDAAEPHPGAALPRLYRAQEAARARLERLYLDYADGLLEREEFAILAERYTAQSRQLGLQIEALRTQTQQAERVLAQFSRWAQRLDALEDAPLDRATVEELVEYVGFAADGTAQVVFSCQETLAQAQALLDALEAGAQV